MTVTLENGQITGVAGNTCKRGDDYARKEVTHPTRIVTSSVCVAGGIAPMVSVKTRNDIPQDKIFDCVHALKGLTVDAPVSIGDIVLENVAGTGVDVIATKAVPERCGSVSAGC